MHKMTQQPKTPKRPTPVADQESSSFSSTTTIMLAASSVLVLSGAVALSYAFDARADFPAQAVVSTSYYV